MEQFLNDFPQDARVVYRHVPLGHDKSNITIQAAEAAGLQGKFWEMHDFLFEPQTWQNWISQTPEEFETWIKQQASTIGLDAAKFAADLNSPEVKQKITDTQQAAIDAKVNSTPSLFILLDGKMYFIPDDGIRAYSDLQNVLQLYRWSQNPKAFDCPSMTVDKSKKYTATITTDRGDIVIDLFADKAPMAVNSFIYLAKQGWFDGVPFHRVLPGFVAQSGDPTGTGVINPGYQFGNEVSPDLRFDREGRVGMANSGPDSNGSQFFITYGPTSNLDGGFTIFGQVVKGMDVATQLRPRDPQNDAVLLLPDRILRVTIEEK